MGSAFFITKGPAPGVVPEQSRPGTTLGQLTDQLIQFAWKFLRLISENFTSLEPILSQEIPESWSPYSQ